MTARSAATPATSTARRNAPASKAAVDLLYRQSNVEELLKAENFSQFSLDYYSDSLTSTGTPLTSRRAAAAALEKKKARRSSAISARRLKISSFTATPVSEKRFFRTVLPARLIEAVVLCDLFYCI